METAMSTKKPRRQKQRTVPKGANNAHLEGTSLRYSGIRLMGKLPWGTHMCVFFDSKEDLLEMNCSFIEAGLAQNELCFWAVSEPATVDEADYYLRQNIEGIADYRARGQLKVVPGHEWYLRENKFDAQRTMEVWRGDSQDALSRGFDGLRASGNAFWMQEHRWREFEEYEQLLDSSTAGQKVILMCTYPLRASRAVDLLDVIRAHQFTVAKHNGEWEYLESPELKLAREEIQRLHNGMEILSRPFPGHELLTPQERIVLAQVVRGASSKEAARALRLSPRTVEFHRRNIMRKLGASNVADLLVIVLGDSARASR
jgi:DNA-binding CsgD family transcriptional regulator